jgi:hypothetical protein
MCLTLATPLSASCVHTVQSFDWTVNRGGGKPTSMSRFYGTDLTWGLSDLKAYVQRDKQKEAALNAVSENYGSLKLGSDGRSSIVC